MRKCRKMSLFRAHGTLHLILGSSAHPLIRSSSILLVEPWYRLQSRALLTLNHMKRNRLQSPPRSRSSPFAPPPIVINLFLTAVKVLHNSKRRKNHRKHSNNYTWLGDWFKCLTSRRLWPVMHPVGWRLEISWMMTMTPTKIATTCSWIFYVRL